MIKSWDKVSINLFKKMRNVPQDDDYTFNLIALLTGKTLDEVLEQPLAITSMESKNLVFIENPPRTGMVKLSYKLGDTKYVPRFTVDNLTTAQYIDFQCLGNGGEDNITETLACVLIPEGKKYNTGYTKEQAIKDIGENMSIEDALSVCGFFTKWSEILLRRTMRSYKRILRRAIRKAPTKEVRKQTKEAYKEFCSLGWEQWIAFLSSPEYRGKKSTNIQ